jgi:hypothetical protein
VPVDEKLVATYSGYPANVQGWAKARVDVIHELMRMEMPDRYSDIQDDPVTKMTMPDGSTQQMARPSVSKSYLSVLPPAPNFKAENAKCLYLLVSRGLDDPDVMSEFADDEIAADSIDGMRYFIDGCGQPIFFVRWPAGFSSPLHPWNVVGVDALGNPIAVANKIYPTTHDPFDPLRTHVPQDSSDPFFNPSTSTQIYPPLYPLIFSGGPDRITDVYLNGIPNAGGTEFQYSQTNKTTPYSNNPYVFVGNSWTNGGLFGMPADLASIFTPSGVSKGDGVDNSIDNISNQDLSETQ